MLRIDQRRLAYIILSNMISKLVDSSANILFRFTQTEIAQIVLLFKLETL